MGVFIILTCQTGGFLMRTLKLFVIQFKAIYYKRGICFTKTNYLFYL